MQRWFKSSFIRTQNLSSTYFSIKKQIRLQKKLEEEKKLEQTNSLDSVVDQQDYTIQQLNQFIEMRIKHTKEVAMEKQIPLKALIGLGLVALPSILLPGSIFFMVSASQYLHLVPALYTAALKYQVLSLCFTSGIHWGVAMSLHEQQIDSLNSSKAAKTQFGMGTIPIFFSMYIVDKCGYDSSTTLEAIESLGILSLFILILDFTSVKQQQLPKWWLKAKGIYLSAYFLGIGMLWYLWYAHEDKVKQKETYYRRTITRNDLLQ